MNSKIIGIILAAVIVAVAFTYGPPLIQAYGTYRVQKARYDAAKEKAARIADNANNRIDKAREFADKMRRQGKEWREEIRDFGGREFLPEK